MTGEGHFRFGTVINCIDGRVQELVTAWLKERYQLDYVDMITEPGPERVLAGGDDSIKERLRKKVEISIRAHGSSVIALAAHHDCAGNPATPAEQQEQVREGLRIIRQWGLATSVVGLWIDEQWQVEEVSC